MKITSPIQLFFNPVFILTVIGGCSEAPTDPANPKPQPEGSGFTASVSGTVNGEISGDGVVVYLPPNENETSTGIRPGYFLIANLIDLQADTSELKDFVIAFRIPEVAQPGDYTLKPPDPLKVGETFNVRVETGKGEDFTTYENISEGTLSLDTFSPDRTYPDNSDIKGSFRFVTENRTGDRIAAKGNFSFSPKVVARTG